MAALSITLFSWSVFTKIARNHTISAKIHGELLGVKMASLILMPLSRMVTYAMYALIRNTSNDDID